MSTYEVTIILVPLGRKFFEAVQMLLGHATIQMTMRYAHLAPSVLRSAVTVLPAAEKRETALLGRPLGQPVVNA